MQSKKQFSNQSGYTLIEMLLSMGIFAILMIIVVGIFQAVVVGQRNAIAAQNTQESMRYALEVISREIRTAVKSEGDCLGVAVNKVFNTSSGNDISGPDIYFKNQKTVPQCVHYYLNNGRLMVDRDGVAMPITPDEIEVTNLDFSFADDLIGAFHTTQPRLTISMDVAMAKGKETEKQKIKIQTTISSRHYE